MTSLRPLILLACLALVACASPTTPSPSAAAVSPSSMAIVLHETPADLGCDAMPVDYTSVVFHIDPAAAEPVTAETDKGVSLVTYWPAGYRADEAGVRTDKGVVVVTDLQSLHVDDGRLHGGDYGTDLCWGPTTLYVSPAVPGG